MLYVHTQSLPQVMKRCKAAIIYEIWGSHSGVDEDTYLLGRYTVSKEYITLVSRIKQSLNCLNLHKYR